MEILAIKQLLRVCFNKTKSLSWFAGDEEYTCWSAGHTNNCGVAILVCIALKGYHPLTTYQWFEDDTLLKNPYPLLYTGKVCALLLFEITQLCRGEAGAQIKSYARMRSGNDTHVFLSLGP